MKPNDESSLLACDACGSCHKTGVIIRGEYYYTVCDTCLEQSDSLVAAKIARRKDEEIAKLRESLKIVRRNLAEALTKIWMKELEETK
jgi:hypothetical protein